MRVKVPCNDEGDFYVRLADHVAEHGLRVPSRTPLPIGERLRVALEFRDGGTLSGEAVVAEHVRLGNESGVIVRFVRFDRSPSAKPQRASGVKPNAAPPPRPSQIAVAPPPTPPPVPPPSEADVEIPEISGAEEIASTTEASNGSGAPSRLALMAGKMRAAAARGRAAVAKGRAAVAKGRAAAAGFVARTSRKQRIAAIAAVAVAVLGSVGLAIAFKGPNPEERAAEHVASAERKLAAGHVTGEDGALEHLLEAKKLAPENRVVAERLAHVADMLEKLGAKALRRGDLEVASIHLEGAALAAPDSQSIREKLDALARKRTSRQRTAR